MKALVGLGNPGKEYDTTWHNAGFQFIDYCAEKFQIGFSNKFRSLFAETRLDSGQKLILLKPQNYMNNSGSAVLELKKFYKLDSNDICICFDDLDLPVDTFKIQHKKYPKVHNGVNDIIATTATDEYTFVRIGIENRSPVEREFLRGREYVLQKSRHDFTLLFRTILLELLGTFDER